MFKQLLRKRNSDPSEGRSDLEFEDVKTPEVDDMLDEIDRVLSAKDNPSVEREAEGRCGCW